ncbi:MAG: NAD(P)/FAD-dependent oxidoreductase, partial [Limisphaerales bacterium]
PEVSAGLKRGFTFFHHTPGKNADFADRSSQLLVAASPNDRVADTHWYRPDFDHFLVRKAVDLGVHYLDQTFVKSIAPRGNGWKIILTREGHEREIYTGFLIDASGANSVLAQQFSIPTNHFQSMPKVAGVWAHFRNVPRLDSISALQNPSLPYPPDDAAVHHIFPGGWCWVLRFNNGLTSAGAAFVEGSSIEGSELRQIWEHVLRKMPSLAAQFQTAEIVTPFYGAAQLSFIRARITGPNWAMLPSAAGFVDPLLSTGFALTLLGIDRLAQAFDDKSPSLEAYAATTRAEFESAADLVGALYAKMHSFDEFALLTLLYFAAMSFTETVWRLDRPELASSFLLTNDIEFSRSRAAICAAARCGQVISRELVGTAIAPYDLAGLTDWKRQNWYPVDWRDLSAHAYKVRATEQELQQLFRKLGISMTT